MRTALLKHACVDAGQYGLNVSSADYGTSGVRLLRTTDLTNDGIGRDGIYLAGPVEARFLVAAGDILFTRSGATIGKAHLAGDDDAGSAFAGYLVRFRPGGSTDSRYIFYTTQTKPFQEQVETDAVVSTIPNFNADRYANIRIPLPEPSEQRRIADFLDDQVARIDNIIAARREQASLLTAYLQAHTDEKFVTVGRRSAPASRFLRVLPGWAFPSSGYSDDPDDVRLLRGVNLGVGEVRWDDVAHWPRSDADRLQAFELRAGDVVLGMDRPWIGDGMRIARISQADLPCLLLQRVAKLIPGPRLNPAFAYWAFRSTTFRQSVEADLTGLSVPHLSGEQIISHRLPVLETDRQDAAVAELEDVSRFVRNQSRALESSIGLMAELKRSLITAAVTGEFDVSSADGSRVPA